MIKHPSATKTKPDNVEELHALRSVRKVDEVFGRKEVKDRKPDPGPQYHNPFKGMKV